MYQIVNPEHAEARVEGLMNWAMATGLMDKRIQGMYSKRDPDPVLTIVYADGTKKHLRYSEHREDILKLQLDLM